MLFIVHFHDNETVEPDLRARHMAAHLAFLGDHKDQIHAAGPLKEQDGQIKSGLWLVDVESTDAAWALVHADPFWPTGLRDRVEIKQWVQVFADGKALI
ncbi:YciI family protein [uncultured Roseobacter sp.]|uniref:YciI family protein n=1 Tax=uncultured Roseobacter sp. TaxID=114847 RepID=UPI002625DDF8|nr:YciI family protein [uncultured Roseobacter sp.]